VTLEAGVLEGIHFGRMPDEVAFLGVPYAAPPVADLRWKPPRPAGHWTGIRDATRFAAVCPQPPAGWLPHLAGNEDCLYLNVWTAQKSSGARQPVIVYFHGGSNRVGYSQLNPLGPALAPLGVVFVSANYRLGALGFLAHPALSAESEHHSSGNYGLLDQLQALKWVRDNISRFGGDPGRITVMGQSAGAVDICLLMTSPMASGLFERAIMESGDCLSSFNKDIRRPIRYNSIVGTGEDAGRHLAKRLGVADDAAALGKLRGFSADEILKAGESPAIAFDAIVDGWVVPEQPAKVFAEGRQMHIPVLVGSNANEATVFGPGPTTVDEYKKFLRGDTGEHWGEELRAYPVESDVDVPAQSVRLRSDAFAFGAYETVKAMRHAGQKTYLYYFTFTESGKRAALGAYHGEELMFLCDSFPADWQRGPDEDTLGQAMRTYWTRFATAGNPNISGLPEWSAFDLKDPQFFELGRRAMRPRPVLPQMDALNRIMHRIFADAGFVASN
jgi:para-nitrobenzyl esterase